jgi:hypothetical protein
MVSTLIKSFEVYVMDLDWKFIVEIAIGVALGKSIYVYLYSLLHGK